MPVPISQGWTVATYVLKQKLRGRKRYPFVLMLEPRSGRVLYWDRTHLHEPDVGYQADFPEVDDCGDLYVISDSFSDFLAAIQQHAV